MTADELAIKLTSKVEFMILQYLPRPTCATKQQAHRDLVQEVKDKIAQRLSGNNGINITITA